MHGHLKPQIRSPRSSSVNRFQSMNPTYLITRTKSLTDLTYLTAEPIDVSYIFFEKIFLALELLCVQSPKDFFTRFF